MKEELILDLEGVMDRLDGDHELYQDIVRLFLEGFSDTVRSLLDAAGKSDGLAFGRSAHACKGALGNLGAMRGWQKAYQLEQAGKSGLPANAVQLVAELEAEVAAFKDEYQSYLKTRAAGG